MWEEISWFRKIKKKEQCDQRSSPVWGQRSYSLRRSETLHVNNGSNINTNHKPFSLNNKSTWWFFVEVERGQHRKNAMLVIIDRCQNTVQCSMLHTGLCRCRPVGDWCKVMKLDANC